VKKGLIALIVLVIIVIIGFSWYFGTYNKFVALEESVNSSWSEIDNQMLRRADLIPNIVNTVKGYAAQEKDIFTAVAEARSKLIGAGSAEDKIAANNELDSALSRLLVVVENYPELKSDKLFTQLMDELSGTENRISVARKRYNDIVKDFNTKIKMFPSNIIAGMSGYEQKPYYEIPDYAKTNPQVNF